MVVGHVFGNAQRTARDHGFCNDPLAPALPEAGVTAIEFPHVIQGIDDVGGVK